MKKKQQAVIDSILNSINQIEKLSKDLVYEDFISNKKIQEKITKSLKSLEKKLHQSSRSLEQKYSITETDTHWQRLTNLSSIITKNYTKLNLPDYLGIDLAIIWEITKNTVPKVKTELKTISTKIETN
ncbi:HepT-like ribonuclease domain-containing protein [Fuchsiella alkaliacetigena]|uniref:HepT-like ribonuclease domain-containing protein n=1 Tax=Fuchsiella alkaliacetigena TaxID=957042 RepID=UPI002009F8A0|nr:hypothetical protein [Fuchsiella alkaliacetigena]MCK8823798.1 hypothetical protein [Fuchsiella alkaliacetigena]